MQKISKQNIVALLKKSSLPTALFKKEVLIWANEATHKYFGNFENPSITSEQLAQQFIVAPHMRAPFIERIRELGKAESPQAVLRPLKIEVIDINGNPIQVEIIANQHGLYTLIYINVFLTFPLNNQILCETEKMASLGRLSEGLAHEINNPLSAIGQNIQLIWHRLLMNTPQNRTIAAQCGVSLSDIENYLAQQNIIEMFETVLEQNIRASKIIHEMLQFAPNEHSHKYLPQNIKTLVQHALVLAQRDYFQNTDLELQNIQIDLQIPSELPHVVCQAWKMQQAFFAIIKNAAEAIHLRHQHAPSGQLTICAKELKRCVQIQFIDNGVGMDTDTASKAFEPYFTTKSGNKGTGLGLASCYYIIHQEHFGQIDIKSEVGVGTTFTVSLPFQRQLSIPSTTLPQ